MHDNIKFLENLKQGVKRTIQNNNLHYMIDLTFKNINRFFLQLFEAGENDPKRNYSDRYYLQLVEINTLAEILLH